MVTLSGYREMPAWMIQGDFLRPALLGFLWHGGGRRAHNSIDAASGLPQVLANQFVYELDSHDRPRGLIEQSIRSGAVRFV